MDHSISTVHEKVQIWKLPSPILLKFGRAVDTIKTCKNPEFHPNRTTPSIFVPPQKIDFLAIFERNPYLQTAITQEPQILEGRS